MAFDYYNFGLFLRKLRRNNGLTLNAVSEMTGLEMGDLSSFENGEKEISVGDFCKLLNAYEYIIPPILAFYSDLRRSEVKDGEV